MNIKNIKKVLLITNDFPPCFSGGISRFYFNLCKRGFHCQFRIIAPLCESAKSFDEKEGLDVVRVRTPLKRSLVNRLLQIFLFTIYTFKECIQEDIAAIWCGHVYIMPLAYFVKIFFRKPYFIVFYGGEHIRYLRRKYIALFWRYLIKHASFLIAISNYTRSEIEAEWRYTGDVFVLHPGVNLEYFRIKNEEVNKESSQNFKLLTVGTLVKRKGHDQVLRALFVLKDRLPNIEYIIIGDGPERNILEKLAFEELGLEGKVKFLGYVDEDILIEHYTRADVFIMPSRKLDERCGTEGFGIVFLEANACGLPVIAGNTGGVADAVVHGKTGLLVDPESISDISAAIEMLYYDRTLASSLGRTGRKRVEKQFSWECIAEQFQSIIISKIYLNRI